ncbi:hypothetical protein D3C72_2045840 [compost metagenome]
MQVELDQFGDELLRHAVTFDDAANALTAEQQVVDVELGSDAQRWCADHPQGATACERIDGLAQHSWPSGRFQGEVHPASGDFADCRHWIDVLAVDHMGGAQLQGQGQA